MKHRRAFLSTALALASLSLLAPAAYAHDVAAAAGPAKPLKVGVTLHPYYSWTKNVVGDAPVEVRSILPGEIDVDDYQPNPADIQKIADLDAIVVNALGHDEVINKMIEASGNKKLVIIKVNEGTPLVKGAHGEAVNSHTFISFTNAIQQTYLIAKALGALQPQSNDKFQANAADYAKRLRAIKAKAAGELVNAKVHRVVTVHDGYTYLMQEFGFDIAGVVQPAHGLQPSAAELKDMVSLLKREHVKVVFAEDSFPEAMKKVLRDEGGARIYQITHIATGQYTADKFEKDMQKNVDVMVEALVKDPNT
jgi:zinc transport system substrate-binding protein